MNRAWYLLLATLAPLAWIGCDGNATTRPNTDKSTADWIAAGDAALGKNDADGALTAFDKAVDNDPDSAQARQRRAQAYLALKQPDRAVDDCTAALKIDGKLVNGFLTRGQAEKALGQPDKAEEDFSKAIELSPDRADILAARGAIYQQMAGAVADQEKARKLLESALKDFDRALKVDRGDATTFMRRAEILLEIGDYEAALADCDKALELDPDLTGARISRARAFIAKGEIDKALADCDASIKADEKRPDAYVVRAKARLAQSLEMRSPAAVAACGEAADDCRKALSLPGPDQRDAETLKRVKKWTAAAHDVRGLLYDRLKADRKACDEFATALSLDPGLIDALVHRALNRGRGKDSVGALSDCNSAIDIDRSRPDGYYGRGEVYRRKAQYPEAIKDFEEAVSRKYAKGYSGLAMVYYALGDAEQRKIQAFSRVRNGRDRPEYKTAVEKATQYWQKCIDNATKALEADRHQPDIYLPRALAYANSHTLQPYATSSQHLQLAFNDLSAAIAEDPLASNAYYYRAVVFVNAKRYQDAIRDFSRAIELQPNFAIAYQRRAVVYKAMDDRVSAAADVQRYKELMAKFKQELSVSVDRPDELFGRSEEPSLAGELGPAFQPLLKAKKELEAKLDGAASAGT